MPIRIMQLRVVIRMLYRKTFKKTEVGYRGTILLPTIHLLISCSSGCRFVFKMLVFFFCFVFFSMNMIYTIKKRKILRKINYIQRNLDDKRSARH